MMKKHYIAFLAMAFTLACASKTSKKDATDPVAGKSSSSDDESNIEVSKSYRNFVNALSNDPLTGKAVARSEVESLVRNLESAVKSDAKQRENHMALIAAKRIAGQSYSSVADAASRLADQEMKKNIDRQIPVIAKLELALAALKAREITMAEHWLSGILESKVPSIKAAGYTLQGIIEYNDGRVPEAVNSWLLARKEVDKYQAATLNLAVVSLKFGAYKFADQMLKDLNDDWLVMIGKATVARMDGNAKPASDLCDRALRQDANRLSLYNCAVVEFQGNNDYSKALKLLSDASSKRGGGAALDKQINQLSEKVRREGAAAKRQEKAAKEAPAEKAKVAPTQDNGSSEEKKGS
jgi:tetratricopeptide (TPR) repeat protein